VNDYLHRTTVTVGPRDPDFVDHTACETASQKNRCRLCKRGKTEMADLVADEINHLITEHRRTRLSKLADAATEVLWKSSKPRSNNCQNTPVRRYF